MKKLVKFVLVLVAVACLSLAPLVKQGPGTPGGPGPDDRPIGYIIMLKSIRK